MWTGLLQGLQANLDGVYDADGQTIVVRRTDGKDIPNGWHVKASAVPAPQPA